MDNDTLGLYGPEDSKYLHLVARRAAAGTWVAMRVADWCRCLPLVDGGRGDDIADGDERV